MIPIIKRTSSVLIKVTFNALIISIFEKLCHVWREIGSLIDSSRWIDRRNVIKRGSASHGMSAR